MIKQLKKITQQMLAGANIATIMLMLIVGFADFFDPVDHPYLALSGLAFPVFAALNAGFLIFWIVFKPKFALIPFLGFIAAYVPMNKYMPLNVSHDAPEGCIKVLSYNVWLYGKEEKSPDKPNEIVDYIIDQDADIVCLQESFLNEKDMFIDTLLMRHYPHRKTIINWYSPDAVSIYSKHPILSSEQLPYDSKTNLSMACRIKIGNDTLVVINNHLESTTVSAEGDKFKGIIKGDIKGKEANQESKKIIEKLADAVSVRASQADAVAKYIKKHNKQNIICCGDFNDGPISYARRTIAKDLTDCYLATGNGPGISYYKSGFLVRIDNIMCSDDWEPYECKIDNKIKASDHYPISCWLKKR